MAPHLPPRNLIQVGGSDLVGPAGLPANAGRDEGHRPYVRFLPLQMLAMPVARQAGRCRARQVSSGISSLRPMALHSDGSAHEQRIVRSREFVLALRAQFTTAAPWTCARGWVSLPGANTPVSYIADLDRGNRVGYRFFTKKTLKCALDVPPSDFYLYGHEIRPV